MDYPNVMRRLRLRGRLEPSELARPGGPHRSVFQVYIKLLAVGETA